MISDFKIFPVMLLRQLNCGLLSVSQLFYVITKENLHFSLICSFYCCLVKRGWALKVAKQFAILGLVAYKPIAYKKDKCTSSHISLNVYL